jgi:hypothetical protein
VQRRWSFNGRSSWALFAAPILAVASVSVAGAIPAQAHNAPSAAHILIPNQSNNLDCNGWSLKYRPIAPAHRALCTDPHGPLATGYSSGSTVGTKFWSRFIDNGHYVGHDEPSVKFISNTSGSGNTMTYFMQVPRDPVQKATNNGKVVDAAELSPAIWFGLPLCDPMSYPLNPCTPDSDTNSGGARDPNAAGSAFMELQFYAPGITPFVDGPSCLPTKWCSALTIDSLESKFNFVGLNPNCPEPVNFAFLQRNGVPAGPPSPQKTTIHTLTPNNQTLQMNAGDVLAVEISDPAAGFTTKITDLTTGQSGFMVASAGNGFANTGFRTCQGHPHTFHAEYDTARQRNQVPWAALEGGVLMQEEIGHGETCASLLNKKSFAFPGFSDGRVFDTCVGGTEGTVNHHPRVGEGPCNARTGICKRAETEGKTGPIACPSNNFASGKLCEFSDGFCLPQGTRSVLVGGKPAKETSPVNFCENNRFENGDLDFDGISYRASSWPNGSPNVPESVRFAGPFMASGAPYPNIQFETDAPGSEFQCNLRAHLHCVVPPLGAKFYPFWTLTNTGGTSIANMFEAGACIWNFGNVIPGVTTNNLGKDAEYGSPHFARFGGTATSAVQANPEVTSSCPALTEPPF